MIIGPPPKFHGTRDILGMGHGFLHQNSIANDSRPAAERGWWTEKSQFPGDGDHGQSSCRDVRSRWHLVHQQDFNADPLRRPVGPGRRGPVTSGVRGRMHGPFLRSSVLADNLVRIQRVGLVVNAVWKVDDAHGDQGDAEVPDLGEQPVQLRLV